MAARKNRPVLYEVIRRSRRYGESQRRAVPPSQAAASEAARAPRVVTAGEEPSEEYVDRREVPLIEFVDQHVYVVLHRTWAIAACAALLVVLVLAFQFGRMSARPAQPGGESDLAFLQQPQRDEPPAAPRTDDGVVLPQRSPTAERPAEQPRSTPSITPPSETAVVVVEPFPPRSGASYLVIQHFPKRAEADAVRAREYMRSNGVPCVIADGGRDYVLVSTEPFDLGTRDRRPTETEQRRAAALRQRVRDLGKNYIVPHGYGFEQCDFRVFR